MALFRQSNDASSGAGLKQGLLLAPVLALSLSPLLTLSCMAQTAATPTTSGIGADVRSNTGTTILPTDVVPMAGDLERNSFGENLQLRILQRLPSRLYFSSSVEVTGRWESNPFQFPTKRKLLSQLPPPQQFRTLSLTQQAQIYDVIGLTGRSNGVFRALPNVSGGWTLTPHTRLFTNYFMIRDQLSHSMRLNTVIHSYAVGLQQDVPIGSKGSAQFEFQGRELWQLHQQSVFDFLPGITLSYIFNPRTVGFVNALVQMRGKAPFQAPKKEIDPFYTWGLLYQRNGWTFSASTTFVQNFREPFRGNATIRKNNYVFISDFEVARRVLKEYPGLQAFVRAEPIWNGHSHATPGLAGVDFRLFAGMRFAMAKPALTATLNQIREQLQENGSDSVPAPPKPSAQQMITPAELVAHNPQPIHGYLENNTLAETCMEPDGQKVLIADYPTMDSEPSSEHANSEPQNSIAANIADSENDSASAQAQSVESNAASTKEVISEIPSSSSSSSSSSEPSRTLEMVAQATASSPNTSATSNEATVASAEDENAAIQAAAANLNMPADASALHNLLDQASDQSNANSLRERTEKIKELAAKHEEEHKLAMAVLPTGGLMMKPPVEAPFAPSKALPVLPLATINKTTAAPSPSALPLHLPGKTGKAPLAEPVKSAAAKDLKNETLQIKSVELSTANKVVQPINPSSVSSMSSIATTVPKLHTSGFLSSDKKMVQPVPISSRISSVSPKAPEPVLAKPTEMMAIRPTNKVQNAETQPSIESKLNVAANKDGSIPISALKTEALSKPSVANVPEKKDLASVKTIQSEAKSESNADNKIAVKPSQESKQASQSSEPSKVIASANIPSVKASFTSISTPAISNIKPSTISNLLPKQSVAPAVKLELPSSQAQSAVNDEVAATISELETEISSPKIAMASYESNQLSVIDDPLIGEEERPASSNKYEQLTKPQEKSPSKSASKSKTEMKLIPPFPTIDQGRNSSLKNSTIDIKVPVVVH